MTEQKNTLQGIIGFPVTPWNDDLELDEAGFRTHVQFLLDSGLDALAFCGSNGELHSITLEEYKRISMLAGELVGDSRYLIFGVGQSWQNAMQQATLARQAGANAILCMAPYMADPNESGLADYYTRVADAAELPVIMYQTKWSGLLPLTLLDRLANVKNIAMVKDENGNLSHYLNIRQHFGSRFRWINGMAEPFVPSYWKLGVETFTSGLACFMPQTAVQIRQLAIQDQFEEINIILDKLVIPMYSLRNRRPGYRVSMIKTGMNLAGHPGGRVRPPLIEMDLEDREDLRAVMKGNGLL